MNAIKLLGCACEAHDLLANEYRTSEIGSEEIFEEKTKSSVLQCRLCQRIWLKLDYLNDADEDKNHWLKGIIAKKDVAGLQHSQVKEKLESLSWILKGGAFYKNEIVKHSGEIKIE